MASANVKAPSLRCCGCQPESRPARISVAPIVCVTIKIGAISIEKIVSMTDADRDAKGAEQIMLTPRLLPRQDEAQALRKQHDDQRRKKQPERRTGIDDRPDWKERLRIAEIARDHLLTLQGQDNADDQRQRPNRRDQIRRRAHAKVQPPHRRQSPAA